MRQAQRVGRLPGFKLRPGKKLVGQRHFSEVENDLDIA